MSQLQDFKHLHCWVTAKQTFRISTLDGASNFSLSPYPQLGLRSQFFAYKRGRTRFACFAGGCGNSAKILKERQS